MSQHSHTATTADGKTVSVRMGYDRILDYVFCTVMEISENGEILYSNLADEEAGTEQQEVEYFRPILISLGLDVPETMFTEVTLDQIGRVGNRSVEHF